MKKLRIFLRIIKNGGISKFALSFLAYFMLTSVVIMLVEPGISSLFDAVWYCFVSVMTIGFGDLVAVTVIGRVATILLAVYGVVFLAILTAVIVNYFTELQKVKANESIVEFMEKLEHLDTLSKEELREISEKVARFKLSKQGRGSEDDNN